MLAIDVVAFRPQHIHTVTRGLLVGEGIFIILILNFIAYYTPLHTLSLLYVPTTRLQDRLHLGVQAYILCYRAAGALVLHLAQNFFVRCGVLWMVIRIV